MKTNEQIAEKWANEYAGIQVLSTWHIRKAILAALNEAATPQVDWSKAVDWPTSAGLWLATRGDSVCLVTAWMTTTKIHRRGALIRFISSNIDYAFSELPEWRFFGPIDLPLPSPPAPPAEPDPWDYQPQEGDYVWVSDGVRYSGAREVVKEGGLLCIKPPVGQFHTVDICKNHNYRFAKATVEPPPSGGVR